MRIKILLICVFVIIMMLFVGCGGTTQKTEELIEGGLDVAGVEVSMPSTEPYLPYAGNLIIAVAASLQNAFEKDLLPMFAEQDPGFEIIGTFDGSGKLQTQIEEGLDASLFFSAAMKQMNALVEGGFIDEATIVKLLENEVVLITRIDAEIAVTGFENISDAASVAIGDPASVPAGQYAEEILTSLGTWDEIFARASQGTNVTEVLNWVAEGSAEVGIVYMTDAAMMQDKVRVIAVAPEGTLKSPVVYPVGLKTDLGGKEESATAFLEFLKSPEAASVFESYGFKVIN